MSIYYPPNAKKLPGPKTIVIRLNGRDFSIRVSDINLYPDAEDVTDDYKGKVPPCTERRRRGLSL